MTQFDDLCGVIQVSLEVGGIDDDNDQVRRRQFRQPIEQDIAGNLLVEGLRAQAVGARQIEHPDVRSRRSAEQPALLSLDGDAGVIAHLGAQSRQRVEQGCLPAVGISGEDDMRVAGGGSRTAGPRRCCAFGRGGGSWVCGFHVCRMNHGDFLSQVIYHPPQSPRSVPPRFSGV